MRESVKKKVVILGGGVGGLSAGWMLGRTGEYHVTIVERAPVTGGVCATFQFEDFLLDYGPHKSYSAIPGILEELKALLGDEFLCREKKNSIYLFNTFLKYPVSMLDLATNMGFNNLVQTAVSASRALLKGGEGDGKTESYEQYVLNRFGRKIYELVFEPLAEKIWGDPSTLSSDIARTRIPSTNIFDVAFRAVGFKKESALTDAKHFYYPRRGFGRIPQRMAEEIIKFGGVILTSATPTKICTKGHHITEIQASINDSSETLPCDMLISSVPLDMLVALLGGAEESDLNEVLHTARRLQYRTAFLVYVFLRREVVTDHHWIFFPERDIVFGRVFEQKRMSPEMAPKDRTVLCCDFTDSEGGELWNQTDDQLAARCVSDLEKIGMIERSWVEKRFVIRLPKFYPRYDLLYKQTITALYDSLKRYDNLLSTGRIGFYNYNNSDHCVDMGKFIADSLTAGKSSSQIWTTLEQRVVAYRIVD
jgi:protoporphyrinogen oxidase